MFAMLESELATALAAIDAVPSVLTRLLRISLPKWNMPFSRPLGTPMARIRRMYAPSGFSSVREPMRIGLPGRCSCRVT